MTYRYLDIASTQSVRAAQAANGSGAMWARFDGERPSDRFTPNEAAFIAARDSFYIASVSESGWPYVQHRGGPAGFLKVLDETTLGFADFRGNRQYITLGNVNADDRVALILMDYAHRARLKIMGHIAVHDLAAEPRLAEQLDLGDYKGRPERAFTIRLDAFDWNCPQHITPRYTAEEVRAASAPILARLTELENENAALRARIADAEGRSS
jgi:predicted pyridoxine 5'-phosphate oxidase superfamily flavin-nucleotide-binding protein